MAISQGINFRSTAAYVTDPTGTTYEISLAVNYPRTTPQGHTVGWAAENAALNKENNSTGVDARLAGSHWFADGTNYNEYAFDLDAANDADLSMAFGEIPFNANGKVSVYDDTTLLATVWDGAVGGNGRFADMNGDVHTNAANWVSNHTVRRFTFSTVRVRIRIVGHGGDGAAISHLACDEVAGASFMPRQGLNINRAVHRASYW